MLKRTNLLISAVPKFIFFNTLSEQEKELKNNLLMMRFAESRKRLFNFGPSNPSGVHAPSAAPDGKGGIIIIFNMNAGKPTGE